MDRIENNFPDKQKKDSSLTIQQEALLRGMMQKNGKAVTEYAIDKHGNRAYSEAPSAEQIRNFLEQFKGDPKEFLAYARENLFSIMKDAKLPVEKKKERVRRYIDAYFDLMIRIDRKTFPPSGQVCQGVPKYVTDGLSDMGSDPKTDPQGRGREKIRVDKKKIFEQSKEMFYQIFSQDMTGVDSDRLKDYIVKYVSYFVFAKMPYDRVNADPFRGADRSIRLHESADKQLAVCRHHALYAQVLLQAFGLTSRLLKCDVDFGKGYSAHVANLVRINHKWYLLDVTNADVGKNGQGETFMRELPERDIDVKRQAHEWELRRNNGEIWKYRSRDNMFYRIMDNRKS